MKKTAFYVTMTDKFMSGWGMAKGKINKLIIECRTIEQAVQIESAAKKRGEMRYINIRTTKPYYGENVLETWKTWDDLGTVWTGEKA